MAFAKRDLPPLAASTMTTVGHQRAADIAAMPPAERHRLFRETMLRILGGAVAITDAVRSNGGISLSGFGGDLDPETAPISLRGFAEHFLVIEGGSTLYAMYTTVSPDHLDRISPAPQLLFHELSGRVRDLNLFCQQAERDEALRVALQSPTFPRRIDRVLGLAAFLAGYLENLATVGPIGIGLPGKARPGIDLERLKGTIDRHKLMALDKLVEPQRIDEYFPDYDWPHLATEVVRRHETGQAILDGVYFPALYARQFEAKARREIEAKAIASAA